jgi:hypothetical protein
MDGVRNDEGLSSRHRTLQILRYRLARLNDCNFGDFNETTPQQL